MGKPALHSTNTKAKLVKLARRKPEPEVISDIMIQPISDYIDSLHLPYMGGKDNMKDDWKRSLELAYKLGQISMGKSVVSIDGIKLKKTEEKPKDIVTEIFERSFDDTY